MDVDIFIEKWLNKTGGAERANLPVFIGDLCAALDLPRDFDPAEKGVLHAYQYDGPVPGGSFRSLKATGFVDLYRRGRFVLEAKQSYIPDANKARPELYDLPPASTPAGGARGYDRLMRDARLQAENYARYLPSGEPRAPFLLVCDIGRAFEVYFDFAGNGRGYDAFPDARGHRIELARLREPEMRHRLRMIWTDPTAIDPRVVRAEVTRRISAELAWVSESLELVQRPKAKGLGTAERSLAVEETALFMMRLLFCMFAEEEGIELLPRDSFRAFLQEAADNEDAFERGLADLWRHMNDPHGDRWSWAIKERVRYFNGGLFENQRTYRLGPNERGVLLKAVAQDWRQVDPAIFGTLLERALNARERARYGAHYTPRVYVERLVDACVMDVLRADWAAAQAEIGALIGPNGAPPQGEVCYPAALDVARAFHARLAGTRVLDPACGTGNFLYVTLEAMARLEAEVIAAVRALGGVATPLVSPDQFHGLEKNPRAAKIAELVLWIGHLRMRLADDPQSVTDPVLARGAHINFGRPGPYDALLRQDATGEPDLADPAPAAWPPVEFIVGNPPFIGGKDIRGELGDDYARALTRADPQVPASADLVTQWWDRAAAELLRTGTPLRRFGFVTTNSIRQSFSRRVIAGRLATEAGAGAGAGGGGGLSLVYAIPDHPWIRA